MTTLTAYETAVLDRLDLQISQSVADHPIARLWADGYPPAVPTLPDHPIAVVCRGRGRSGGPSGPDHPVARLYNRMTSGNTY